MTSDCVRTPRAEPAESSHAGRRETGVGPQPTVRRAVRITSATACGCDTMIKWEPSSSSSSAPARLAIDSRTSEPAALSPVATTAQEGSVFQAGTPDFSSNADAATGRCDAPKTVDCAVGRSPAKTALKDAGF